MKKTPVSIVTGVFLNRNLKSNLDLPGLVQVQLYDKITKFTSYLHPGNHLVISFFLQDQFLNELIHPLIG